nr:hypothetical protein [Tanacetum cinerariifolium]
MINAQIADLSSHNTKYTSSALTQKVFSNMRRVEDKDAANEISSKPTLPSPTPATTPPPPQELIPSPSHVESTPPPLPHKSPIAQPSSPPPQQPPSHDIEISMALFNQLLETCATLTKKVGNLEQDKIAQAIEITKLKQRVRRLEKKIKSKASGLKRLRKVGTAQRVKSLADTGRLLESQAQVYHLDLEHAQKVLSMQETGKVEPAEVEEVLEVVTGAKLMTKVATTATTTITVAPVPKASAPRRRKGVIIQDPEEAATASLSDEAFARELEAELHANINWDEVIEQLKRKERQDNAVMRYQALKRKPVTEAQARKTMMHSNSIWSFLEKREKEIKEEDGKRKSKNLEQKAVKKQKINEEVEELKTHLQIVPNDEDDVEDLEMLWKRVQERFESSEPKNFLDDFLLNALKTMFEKPNVEANI